MSVEQKIVTAGLKTIISINQAWFYSIVPYNVENDVLFLFTTPEKNNATLQQELEIILGKKIKLTSKPAHELEKFLIEYYPTNSDKNNFKTETQLKLNIRADNFLESLVAEAKSLQSSDIHVETYGEKCRIRFRVDGVLVDRHKLSKAEYPTLINKIKISAACDIAEKRLPQDGRIRFQIAGNKLDIRVSILPTLYGEKIVLRLLGSDASHIHISKLGFQKNELERFTLAVKKPNGIILISGPTGSGKTTTLYATLKELNKATNNILTIEDPIEYTLDGVNQVQLKEDIGLTYAEALKTFLRQDPDIIMLGEIRDAQTAQMAIRAALTGHLVLSTIHTNSAWGTISRLTDMGIPGYLIASTLNLSVAQRLVRILCTGCKKNEALVTDELPALYKAKGLKSHMVAQGCNACYYTGYKGRKAIYEVVNITKELAGEIKQNTNDVSNYFTANNINTLSKNAWALFEQGQTSLEEIYPYLINED